MRRTFLTLVVIAILGIVSQSCENTTTNFDDVVIAHDDVKSESVPDKDDDMSKPGGTD